MGAIYRKELRLCFGGAIGYVVVSLLLLLSGVFVFLNHFVSGLSDFSLAVLRMQWGVIVSVPLLCMRSFATERRMGTERMLASLPMTAASVVVGKFLALCTVFWIPSVIMGIYPLLLNAVSKIPLGTAYAAWLGYVLMGGALIAFGMLISSLCRHEAVAGVLTAVILLGLYFMPTLSGLLSRVAFLSWLGDLLMAINPMACLSGFAYGYFSVTGVVVSLSWMMVSLLLTAHAFRCRRYAVREVLA